MATRRRCTPCDKRCGDHTPERHDCLVLIERALAAVVIVVSDVKREEALRTDTRTPATYQKPAERPEPNLHPPCPPAPLNLSLEL